MQRSAGWMEGVIVVQQADTTLNLRQRPHRQPPAAVAGLGDNLRNSPQRQAAAKLLIKLVDTQGQPLARRGLQLGGKFDESLVEHTYPHSFHGNTIPRKRDGSRPCDTKWTRR
jgi:hypothetical protein